MNLFKILFSASRKIPGLNIMVRFIYKCDVPRKTSTGRITFGHKGLGVVIHPETVIEDDVFIQHHVTIGIRKKGDGCPIIHKNVSIGAYAIILGPVQIGENTVIGAGSIVTHDIPPNSVFYNEKNDVIVPR